MDTSYTDKKMDTFSDLHLCLHKSSIDCVLIGLIQYNHDGDEERVHEFTSALIE